MRHIFLLCFVIFSGMFCCFCRSKTAPSSGNFKFQNKIDRAVLLMYKLYARCNTSILKRNNGQIDTIVKNINYVCLPVQISTPDVKLDTVIIGVFFSPEEGFEIENPDCDYIYEVGFIGDDDDPDFIVIGDNYYSILISQYFITHDKDYIDSVFMSEIKNNSCISKSLERLLDTIN